MINRAKVSDSHTNDIAKLEETFFEKGGSLEQLRRMTECMRSVAKGVLVHNVD